MYGENGIGVTAAQAELAALRSLAESKKFGVRPDYEGVAWTGDPPGTFLPYNISIVSGTRTNLGSWRIPPAWDHIRLDRLIVAFGAAGGATNIVPIRGSLEYQIGTSWSRTVGLTPILRNRASALFFHGVKVRGGQTITLFMTPGLTGDATGPYLANVALRYYAVGKTIPRRFPKMPNLWRNYHESTAWTLDRSLANDTYVDMGTWTVDDTFDSIDLTSIAFGSNSTDAGPGALSKNSTGGAFGRGALTSGFVEYRVGDLTERRVPWPCVFADPDSALHFGSRFMPAGERISLAGRQVEGGARLVSALANYRAFYRNESDLLPSQEERETEDVEALGSQGE